MKKLKLNTTKRSGAIVTCAGLALLAGSVVNTHAQLSSAQKKELSELVSGRASTAAILGSSDSASGGTYEIERDGKDAEFDMIKFGGRGEIGDPRQLGNGDVKWSPVVYGMIGNISSDNRINKTALAGNKIESSITSVQVGAGVKFDLTERFNVTPTIGLLYGHGNYEFKAKTPAGAPFNNLDKDFDTFGVVPGIALGYSLPVGENMITFSSGYSYYANSDIGGSGDLEVDEDGHTWVNKIDADIPLPLDLWDCQLHTGGYVSRTDLFGDITDSLSTDYFYSVNARLVLDTEGKLWKLAHIGLGVTYVFGDDLTGVDFGIEAKFKF